MPIPATLLQLIDQFHNQLASYRSSDYNEAQTRNEFIEPFFHFLGWDVYNQQGIAYAYKDVIYEDSIKVAGGTKAPDYAFRIGGTRKFFVEAKKPSINLKDEITPAYQLRRYAWSAHLPLSILTDFEEFAVYDCRPKPDKSDKASTGRIMLLTYHDYPSHWDEIYDTFSKPAVLKGSFDQFAETAAGKHGTAEVDDAFLSEIERWRELLAHNIALRNPSFSQRDLNYAIQMTIDRLIFLRICEDRHIEFYSQLQSLLNGSDTYARLCQLFHKADERYNSGLFHFHSERGEGDAPDTLTPTLLLDDKPLKDILAKLYYPDSPYEFSVLPADILGQVYERFLGKVIRLTTGHRAVVEDKPEVKKAGGVFYTPTFIVDYIVKNTLGKLLEGKAPGQVGVGRGTPIRVLDMSCGSGSFLLGAYQYLLDWYLNGYTLEPEKWSKGASPRIYQISAPDGVLWKLTTAERKRILLDHIYGVDIDSQAVEVTKLSLLLKVLEGESEESIGKQLSMFRERVLPDLAHNIKCGNSLIGPDFYTEKQSSFLNTEEQYRINAFDWDKEFPQVFDKPARLLWLVTFVTHNSRVSERMVTYGVKSGDPLIFDASERLLIAQNISDCCYKHHIPVVAWNVLPDHVHMILAAEDERELDEQVRKIKGFSSFSYQHTPGLDVGGHVWAQKYHHLLITDQHMLENVYSYVMDNHIKHADQWGQDLIDSFEAHLLTGRSPSTLPTPPTPPTPPTRGLSPLLSTPGDSPLLSTHGDSPLLSTPGDSPLLSTHGDSPSLYPSAPSSLPTSLMDVRDGLCVTPEIACQPSSAGFDVIIGNPPYVRSINLKENAPVLWNIYRSLYKSASEREWDIYLIFVEKGTALLNSSGKLGFILPNKFINSQVGKNLRSILSTGRWLREIVHFGALQVFTGVTTYTCLLFLGHETEDTTVKISRYIGPVSKVKIEYYLPDKSSSLWNIYDISETSLGGSPWEFTAKSSVLLESLNKWPKFASIVQIYQGTGTRADKVFLVENCGEAESLVRIYSYETNKEYLLEDVLLKKALRGRNIGRYKLIGKNWFLIMPYNIGREKCSLIPYKEILSIAPRTMEYLRECKYRLDQREKGRFKGENWYCYGRPQNLNRFEVPEKIIMPDVVNRGECFLDTSGSWLIDTAYALVPISTNRLNIRYILGVLNSHILTYYLRETGTSLRGGYFRMKTAYLYRFPFRTINFSDPADVQLHDHMVVLVDRMLTIHQQLAKANTPAEKTLLQRQIDTTDRRIDALVYELYGLTKEEIRLVEEG